MPFTLSHAAAALPFRRLKPIWPALVIGTFAPDFQYLLHLSDETRTWHGFPELLTTTLPVALLVFWLFEYFVKEPVTQLLPRQVQRRLPERNRTFSFTDWSLWPGVVGWTVVGVTTHILWDSVTHTTLWTYKHWVWLRSPIAVPFHDPMPVYKALHFASTVFGLLAVVLWLTAWYRDTPPRSEAVPEELSTVHKATVVLTMAAVALLFGYPLAAKRFALFDPPIARKYFVVTLFEALALLSCLEMLLYGVVRTLISKAGRRPATALDERS